MKASLRFAVATSITRTAAGCTSNKQPPISDRPKRRAGADISMTSRRACNASPNTSGQFGAKEEPATLELYDAFAAQRAELARRYDSGALEKQQCETEFDRLESLTRAKLAERRQDSAAE